MSNEQTLFIRDALPSEREAMLAVTLAAYGQYAPLMPTILWEGYRTNIIEALTTPDPVERIVAERGGMLVGSVLLYPPRAATYADHANTPAVPEIRLLAVQPEARGQGVARALMAECRGAPSGWGT